MVYEKYERTGSFCLAGRFFRLPTFSGNVSTGLVIICFHDQIV